MSDHDVSQDQPERQPWDRLDVETDPQWVAFVAFRNLGPARSLAAAAREIGRSKATIAAYSGKNEWVRRCRAWDRFCDQRDQLRDEVERSEGRKSMYVKHAETCRRMWELARDALMPDDPKEARDLIATFTPAVQIRMIAVGMENEARARLHMTGRGVDPKDAAKLAEDLIDIALRYVPEDSQGAFLSDITALAGL